MPDQIPNRWEPDRGTPASPWPMPPLGTAVWRGLRCLCPACGKTNLFRGYLRVVEGCGNCGAPLGLARADDAPPYFTIVVVAHIVVPLMLWLEKARSPPLWVHSAIFIPLTLVLALGLLRPIKGGTVGLMLKLGLMKSEQDE